MQKKDTAREKFRNIVRLILKDKEKGMEQFYDEYGRMIFLTATHVGCKTSQADSVVNNVLIRAWKKGKELLKIDNPFAWLRVVTTNCAKDELNEIWHFELNENLCKTENELEKVFSNDAFEHLISCLDDDDKLMLKMKFSAGYSFREIADYFGKPIATITSAYYRALEKIKNFYENLKK